MPGAGLIAAIPALMQLGMSFKQSQDAKDLASNSPYYEIPQEVKDLLASAKKQARDRSLPGADLIEQSIGATTNKGLTAIKNTSGSSVDSLAAITSLYGMEQDQKRNLGIASAENYNRNKDVERDALAMMAGYRDQSFDFNQMQPYLAKSAAASAMRGASQQNMMGGVSSLSSLASGYMARNSSAPDSTMRSAPSTPDTEFENGDKNYDYEKAFDMYMNDPTYKIGQ